MASFLSKALKEVTSTISPVSKAIVPSSESESSRSSGALTLFATTAIMATMLNKYSFSSCIGGIYDKIIVNMTEIWYRRVLEKQKSGSVILDVGIGTAGKFLFYYNVVKISDVSLQGGHCYCIHCSICSEIRKEYWQIKWTLILDSALSMNPMNIL